MGAVFAERHSLTNGNLLKRPVFERSDSNWIDLLLTKTKQYNVRIHSSIELTPIQGSSKKNEGLVYHNLLDKRKKYQPKNIIGDLVRTAVLKKTFSKSDLTNWSYLLYEITEIVNDTLPSFKINKLPERYNEAFLKKTELTMKESDSVMKKLNNTEMKSKWLWPSLDIVTNFFVSTKAYPYLPTGTFSEILNSTLNGWAISNFF